MQTGGGISITKGRIDDLNPKVRLSSGERNKAAVGQGKEPKVLGNVLPLAEDQHRALRTYPTSEWCLRITRTGRTRPTARLEISVRGR